MALSRLEHFIRFGTDAAGIERMLRMVQAILMVVLSRPFLTSGFTKLVAWGNQHVWTEPRAADVAVLSQLRSNIALVRRFFRIFRFLESFQAAHVIYTSFYAPPPPTPPAAAPDKGNAYDERTASNSTLAGGDKPPETQSAPTRATATTQPRPPRAPTEAWLDLFSRTFNGLYLLLEALTLLDTLALPGFSLFGRVWGPRLTTEAQRFWLLALACGLGGGLVRLCRLLAKGPAAAPVPGLGPGAGADGACFVWPGAAPERAEAEMAEWERQRARMRRVVWARQEGRRVWLGEVRTTGWRIARRGVADALDLVVPGSVVGWVSVPPGTVGLCMVVSTWLTGVEVWERCGG